jgi:trimeric autotransporter adhesin
LYKCTKKLSSINIANVTTAGTNAPYPNAIIMAVSGIVNPTLTITPSITNATCNTLGSATLNLTGGIAPFSVTWNTTPVQTGLTATNLTAGNYIATILSGNACPTTSNVAITQTNSLTMNQRLDTTICSGATFTPNIVSNATGYTWSPTNGVSNSSIANPILSPTTTTVYTVAGTLGSCTVNKSFTVFVNSVSMNQRLDTTICNGANFSPNIVSNATGYIWSPVTGVSNTTIANPILAPSTTTVYTVTGTLGLCTISKSFTVFVTNVQMNQLLDTSICNGSSFVPNIISNATAYIWTPTNGVSNSSIANPVLTPISTTTYSILGSIGQCSINKSFTVFVNQSVIVNAGNTLTILTGQAIQLQATGSVGTYLWTPSTGLSSTNILNPTASPQATTIYTLRITNPQGCTNTNNVQVVVIPNCVSPLNAFSPNGDGVNDKWIISNGSCLLNAKVLVYNRYGSLVYENENYKNDWNGTYKEKALPDGTYYYKIEYTIINGQKVFSKGDVTIIR